MYRRMWILVEGKDDSRFANAILRPILEGKYDHIDTWEYAQQTSKKTAGFLKALASMQADYLFLADINSSPCVTAKKEVLANKYQPGGRPLDIVVVIKEIESWYVAGLSDEACRELDIVPLSHTDDVTKEQFREVMPKRFNDSVVDFMTEVLTSFDVDIARDKNRSFCYMMDALERRSGEA